MVRAINGLFVDSPSSGGPPHQADLPGDFALATRHSARSVYAEMTDAELHELVPLTRALITGFGESGLDDDRWFAAILEINLHEAEAALASRGHRSKRKSQTLDFAAVKARTDLATLIDAETGGLKWTYSGKTRKARCPFSDHQDRTPSFVVWTETQTWKCFGCGRGGDVFSFLMYFHGWSLMEAYRRIVAPNGATEMQPSSRHLDAETPGVNGFRAVRGARRR